ncbi:hypothetical protein [Streptomyces sp. NBC_01803]|uniref:hypothetical protein n=1 Tax=Streptomyces sp. NBC_01803 TaxID=2975946 RepID=UPI003FA3AFBC
MTRPPPRRTGTLAGVLCLAPILAWSSPVGAEDQEPAFAAELDRLLADPRLDGGRASVVVRDAADGETLCERGAETA